MSSEFSKDFTENLAFMTTSSITASKIFSSVNQPFKEVIPGNGCLINSVDNYIGLRVNNTQHVFLSCIERDLSSIQRRLEKEYFILRKNIHILNRNDYNFLNSYIQINLLFEHRITEFVMKHFGTQKLINYNVFTAKPKEYTTFNKKNKEYDITQVGSNLKRKNNREETTLTFDFKKVEINKKVPVESDKKDLFTPLNYQELYDKTNNILRSHSHSTIKNENTSVQNNADSLTANIDKAIENDVNKILDTLLSTPPPLPHIKSESNKLSIFSQATVKVSNLDDPGPSKRKIQFSTNIEDDIILTSSHFPNKYNFSQNCNISLPSTNYSDILYDIKQTYCKKKIRKIKN